MGHYFTAMVAVAVNHQGQASEVLGRHPYADRRQALQQASLRLLSRLGCSVEHPWISLVGVELQQNRRGSR